MSLNDLVSSQPEEVGPTPTETENVMVSEQEEQASVTSVNTDGSSDQNINPEQQEENVLKDRTQKRINGLVGHNKELEEQVIRLEAQQEAFEKYNQSQKEKTFEDHSIDTLTRFIADNQDDPELASQVVEARQVIMNKTIDEKVNSLMDKQHNVTSQKEGEQLTNVMIDKISGDRLRDTSSDYYNTAVQCLHELGTDQYRDVNKDQLIASLMAEREYLMKASTGPSIVDRAKTNRNNNLIANTRSAPGGGSDLSSFLKDTGGTLERSSISKAGSAKEAIMKLNMFENLKGG